MELRNNSGVAESAATGETGNEEQLRRELLADLRRLQGTRCAACSAVLCGHETLMSVVFGCKDQPRCLDCLARQMGHDRASVRDHLFAYIRIRPCRMAGWEWANQAESVAAAALPTCMWPAESAASASAQPASPVPDFTMTDSNSITPPSDAEWDAGPLGCGELVMGLRQRLLAMSPGGILKLTATDAGMPEDLPAWCGMTGHILVLGKHPEYWIKRREN